MMTMREMIEGVAESVHAVIPGAKVYVDRIPSGSKDVHFIGLVSLQNDDGLNGASSEKYMFEVLYFADDDRSVGYYDWSQSLIRHFEKVRIGTVVVDAKEKDARRLDDFTYQFTFSLNINLRPRKGGEKMRNLEQEVNYGEEADR